MLGVVGERFPKGGALAMGAMGGIGMLSAGVLGGPGIGYTQDVNIGRRKLQAARIPAAYAAGGFDQQENRFLFFPPVRGFDGTKVSAATSRTVPTYQGRASQPSMFGKQQALKITAAIPATMAVGYLLLLIYFRAIGGYKLVEIGPGGEEREDLARADGQRGDLQRLAGRPGLARRELPIAIRCYSAWLPAAVSTSSMRSGAAP